MVFMDWCVHGLKGVTIVYYDFFRRDASKGSPRPTDEQPTKAHKSRAPFEWRTDSNRRRRALHPPRSSSQQRHRAHVHTQPPERKPATEPRRRQHHAEAKTRVRDNAHLSCRPRYRNGCAILQLLRGRQAISQGNHPPDLTLIVGSGILVRLPDHPPLKPAAKTPAPFSRRVPRGKKPPLRGFLRCFIAKKLPKYFVEYNFFATFALSIRQTSSFKQWKGQN